MNQINRSFKDIITTDLNQYLKSKDTNIIFKKPFALDNALTYRDKLISSNLRNEVKRKVKYNYFLSNYGVTDNSETHKYHKRKEIYANSIYNLNSYIKVTKQKYSLYTHKKKVEDKPILHLPQGSKIIFTNKDEIANIQPGLYEDVMKEHKSEIDAFMKYEYSTVSRLLDYYNKTKGFKKHRLSSYFMVPFVKSKYKEFLLLPFISSMIKDNKILLNEAYPLYLSLAENYLRLKQTNFNLFKKVIKNKVDKKDYLTVKQMNKSADIKQYQVKKREIFLQLLLKSLSQWLLKRKTKILNAQPLLQEQYINLLKIINSPELTKLLFKRFGEILFFKKYSARLKKKKRYLRMFHYKSKFIYSYKTTRINKQFIARSFVRSILPELGNMSWDRKIWIPKLKINK